MTQQSHFSVSIRKKKKKQQTLIQKDTRTTMFIAAIFTIAKICKQPKCPSTDEWIKRCGMHVYTPAPHSETLLYKL